MPTRREHWDLVYAAKRETEVSWYQPVPEQSLRFIRAAAPGTTASILDVGGGASHLVDELLSLGYADVSVLDISQAALDHSKEDRKSTRLNSSH